MVNNLKNLFLLVMNIKEESILISIANVKLMAIIADLNNMKIFKNKINNRNNKN